MSETPDTISAHVVSDDLERALFSTLLEHCGEDIGGTRSINSDKAAIGLLTVAAQLMAQWSKKNRTSLIRQWEQSIDGLAERLRREYTERAKTPPS